MKLSAIGAAFLLSAATPAAAVAAGRWSFVPGPSEGGRLTYTLDAGTQRERLRLECARPGGPVTMRVATPPLQPGRGVRLRFEDEAGRTATVRGMLHRGPAGLRFSASLPSRHRLLALLRGRGALRMHSEPRGSSEEYELAGVAEPLRRFDAGCRRAGAGLGQG